MMPDLLHVIEILDDSLLDGPREIKDSSLGLSLVADEVFLLVHADHHPRETGTAHQVGERHSRGFVSRYACFQHPTPVVDYDG